MPAGREAAEASRRAPWSQPIAQRQANSSSATAALGSAQLVEGGQEQLLDRALERPQGQALLHRAVGGVLVEALEGRPQARQLLAGALWRWRASSIAEVMLPVSARASRRVCSSTSSYWRWLPGVRSRLGEAEAALPAAQGVGVDAENLGGGVVFVIAGAHAGLPGSRPGAMIPGELRRFTAVIGKFAENLCRILCGPASALAGRPTANCRRPSPAPATSRCLRACSRLLGLVRRARGRRRRRPRR